MKSKITIALFGIALISTIAYTAIPEKTQNQLNDFLSELMMKLQKHNEQLPEDRVYAHFDKTLYKPGETIWFTAYVRDGKTLKKSEQSDIVSVQLINPKGAVEKQYSIIAENGVAKGDFKIDENAVGGIYKVNIFTRWMLNDKDPAMFTKKLTVQKVTLPRLKMKLDFMKEAYGARDEVAAELTLHENNNAPLSNYNFDYIVNLGNKTLTRSKGKTGEKGEAMVKFTLPNELKTNDGLLNIMIKYQGQTESISRSVPIILNNINVQLFPEGGDLVNGLTSKVAFKAVNEFGKPADIEGVVIDSKGQELTAFASYHQGMGAFSLTPKANEQYTVKITKPANVTNSFIIRDAMDNGYALEVRKIDKKQVYLTVKSTLADKLYLVGNVRGHKYFSTSIDVKKGENQITIPTKFFPIGVAQFTLFDSKGIERAERLAFVNKDKQINIEIETDKEKYLPREKVKMTIKVSDERGMPMPANLSISVVDDQLLTFADDKSSNILSWMLMEADLRGTIYEPNFYFDKTEEKADLALDYLLMTAGWRRFTWTEIKENKQKRITYKNEKTELSGIIRSAADKQPLENVQVKMSNGLSTKTDKNGKFVFTEFLIKPNLKIEFSKEGYFLNTNDVRQYLTNHNSYMYPKTGFRKNQEIEEEEEEPLPPLIPPLLTPEAPQTTNEEENTPIPPVEEKVESINNEDSQPILQVPKAKIPPPPPVLEEVSDEEIDDDISVEEWTANEEVEMPYPVEEEEEEEETIEEIFSIVEDMPSFPGCEDLPTNQERKQCTEKKLLKYMYSNMSYPAIARENGIEGLVVVQFVVDRDGAIVNAKVVKDIGAGCGEEVLYVVNTMNSFPQKWTPSTQRDRPVPSRFNLPFRFKLSGNNIGTGNTNARSTYRSIPINRNFRQYNYTRRTRNTSIAKYYRAREFAAPIYDKDEPVKERTDFRSTIYWNGNVEIDRKGKKVLEFYTSDAVTSFRITAEGFAADGMIGRGEKRFYTQLPFSLSAKLPSQVVTQDVLKIPVTLVNNTKKTISGALTYNYPKGIIPQSTLPNQITLTAGQAKTEYLAFDVKERSDADELGIYFSSDGFNDAIKKKLTIVSKGFPASVAYSGEAMEQTHQFNLKHAIDGSVDAKITAYPSSLSNILSGLEGILREPTGCFEQTSSKTYPNILVLNYLQETGKANPEVTKRAKHLIEKGYKRLLGFESKNGGFEWFGADPAHIGLTAYGLMEFTDMQKVVSCVDQTMIDRTAKWLMDKRDGTGKFITPSRKLRHMGMNDDATTSIYITWALTEAKFTDLQKEIDFAYSEAKKTNNPYQLGLAANIMFNRSEEEKGQTLLKQLFKSQNAKGAWAYDLKRNSAVGSSGQSLQIETAALATLAMLKTRTKNLEQLRNCVKFIKSKRNSYGSFGSTNSTILALRALTAYAKFSKKAEESGTIEVYANGEKIKSFDYAKGIQEAIVLDGLAEYLTNSNNNVEVKYANTKQPLPYNLSVNYTTTLPHSSKKCVIGLTTKLAKQQIKVGETIRLTTEITNKEDKYQRMTIAIVGIPAGLSAQPWQLKELQEKRVFDYYEIIGNNLVFYYRAMSKSQILTINLDLKAEIAGNYAAPASSAYLYYTNEHKTWTALDRIEILAN